MEELKRLYGSRRGYRTHLKKLLTKANETIEQHRNDTTECDVTTLTDLHEQLRRKRDIISKLDTQIVALIQDEGEITADVCEAEEIHESLSTSITRITQLLKDHKTVTAATHIQPRLSPTDPIQSQEPITLEPPSNLQQTQGQDEDGTGHIATASQDITRLPKLNIPTFSGDTLQWQSFWDCFQAAVHHNPSIAGVQKLNYLRAQLQGSALRVIAGLPLTNANYEHSVTLLKGRYGETHKLVDAHMQALIELSSPPNTLIGLQLFYDSIEGHIRSLQSLGTPQERYGSMLVPIILRKLSAETRRNIARAHGNDQWTLNELQGAILQEIHILEMGTEYPNNQSSLPKPTASFLTNADQQQRQTNTEHQKRSTCVYCGGSHTPINCENVKDKQKRMDIIRRDMLCFNCLGRHKISQCKSKHRCRHCSRRHHTSVCNNAAPTDNSDRPTPSKSTNTRESTDTTTLTTFTTESPPVFLNNTVCLLKTAVATITSLNSEAEANILFDEGSQRSFLTQDMADLLSLKPHHMEDISLSSFGSKIAHNKKMEAAQIHIKTKTGEFIPISVLIVPTIATPLRNTLETEVTQLPYLHDLPLAHPVMKDSSFNISLLIGSDHYWDIVEDHIIRGCGPTAMSSKLGYLLSGPLSLQKPFNTTTCSFLVTVNHDDKNCDLQQFWCLEATGTTPTTDSTDKEFLIEYSRTCVSRQPDGSYCAKFPWKPSHPPLPTNREVCLKRARSLVHRLSQTPGLLQIYNNIITDQIEREFIELVPNTADVPSKTHYIPHHCVKKNSVTTPIRIVYDCSCRQSSNHPSLNDCLQTGPHFLNDLCSIILRFRVHNYAISTDIEKAFLHVNLHKDDRDYTRFFWLKDASKPNGEFDIYRFKTVLFGAVSSPFILYATLFHHLQQHNTHLSRDILLNLYVDNILSGCSSEDEIIQYYYNARATLSEASFNLRAWVTNSPKLRAITHQEKTDDTNTPNNILGILWNAATDQLSLAPKGPPAIDNSLITKRELLQESSKVFDPIGITTPVTIQTKLLIQKLWTLHIEWDEPLGTELVREWHRIAEDLRHLHLIPINRKYFQGFDASCVELHTFSDASTRAYGAVVYLCSQTDTAFVMAKSRVAPLKCPTLPRLELMAALIAARLTKFVMDSLNLISIPVHIWADSQITLYWIQSSKKLPQFVAHRVTEINCLTPSASWKYCPSGDNPADLLTRGVNFQQLQSSSLWLHGPTWLLNKQQWPKWDHPPISHLHAVAAITDDFSPTQPAPPNVGLHLIITVSRFSTLRKLLVVTTYVCRFIHNLRHPAEIKKGPITAQEFHSARLKWIRTCQNEVYWREINNLSSSNQRRLILVRQLRLFLDREGFLRCGGRIHNAPLTEDAKFPYLLPPRHLFTALVVYSTHAKLYHSGVNSTVTAIRQTYWIPTARQYVKTLLRRCTICRKQLGKPYATPDPAPLPKNRTQNLPPFTITGVDFTGALYIHHNNEEQKVYICLFTCATTRAVHLEIVTDLSMETFLLAFRRFASRKSTPHVMMSDNASTYMSAAEELTKLLQSEDLTTSLGIHGVVWKFIPKKAPWFGGFWERMIGLTKNCLKKVLGRSHISLPVLQTMVVEIEAVLNDRPLTYTSSDVDDPQPLTPAHLLYGRKIVRLPHEYHAEEFEDPDYGTKSQLQRQARIQAHLLKSFQSRWAHEYLTSLREYHRTSGHNSQTISVGDIVLIHDDGPRVNWRLAIVTKLLTGGDGLTRAAEIRTSTGTTNRPIAKLYPLEVNHDTGTVNDEPGKTKENPTDTTLPVRRPIRQSAKRAVEQISEWAQTLRAPPEDVEITL